MAIYGYTKNYKLIKPQFNTDTWHDYIYDNLDTIDAIMSAIYASGNWKGFWLTNTTYSAGDVIIDRDTDTMYKVTIDHVTSEDTFAEEQTAHPDYYELWSPNNLAESWAIKMDDKVSNEDYSAKAYAISSGLIDEGSAKEWAVGSGEIGDTGEYSAKKYATDAHDDYISLTTNANIVAVGSNIANVNAVGQSISNVNTVASNVSDVNTVAGVATDVTTVASVADSVPTVANNSANVATVADNISDVNTAASNMTAIQAAPTAASNAATSAIDSANSANASATSAQAAQDALDEVHGLLAIPIGTIFQSIYVDESLDIARALNGQLISSTKFTGFRDWLDTVQTAIPNLFTDEDTWQAEKLLSKFGQVGKFVIDDTAGTIRLPAVVNPQGLPSLSGVGNLVNESLPNFNATFQSNLQSGQTNNAALTWNQPATGTAGIIPLNTGSFAANASGTNVVSGCTGFTIDLSDYSSTYQTDAPVQQEAVQYPYYIQVATGIEETLPAIREYKVNNSDYFGKSMYSDVAPNNASWLASNGQYNARIVYPDYYDWLNSKIGQVITANGGKVVLSTDTITDYDWVVNQDGQTFRLPLLNGEEDIPDYEHEIDNVITGTINSTGQTYTAPNNGLFYQQVNIASFNSVAVSVNNIVRQNLYEDSSAFSTGFSVEVRKGDIIKLFVGYGSGTGTIENCHFTPFKGNGTLYYYVGDTVQDASLINAGAILNTLSGKVGFEDLTTVHCVVETYQSGTSWYRVYDDGWVEQGGSLSGVDGTGFRTVTFLKPFNMGGNPNIQITIVGSFYNAAAYLQHLCNAQTRSDTGFTTYVDTTNIPVKYWFACGQGA